MLSTTINDEKMQITSNDKNPEISGMSDYCINFSVDFASVQMMQNDEPRYEELLSLSEKLGIFSFLDNDEEDIYTELDGEVLE